MMKMRKVKRFTMIEMMTAMAVLVIFLLALMRVFTATQNISNGATAKIGQFERARLVMDMIATDLQTLYYRPDSGLFCYYQTDSPSGNLKCLSLATMRQEPLKANGNPLLYVNYRYDDIWSLKLREYQQGDSYWQLNDNAMRDPDLDTSTSPPWIVLVEGIKSLKVTPFDKNWNKTLTKTPRTVQIELELYSDQTIEMFNSDAFKADSAANTLAAIPENVKSDGVRKFVRVISIKRDR